GHRAEMNTTTVKDPPVEYREVCPSRSSRVNSLIFWPDRISWPVSMWLEAHRIVIAENNATRVFFIGEFSYTTDVAAMFRPSPSGISGRARWRNLNISGFGPRLIFGPRSKSFGLWFGSEGGGDTIGALVIRVPALRFHTNIANCID